MPRDRQRDRQENREPERRADQVFSVFEGDPVMDNKVVGARVSVGGGIREREGVTDGAGNLTLALRPGWYDVSVCADGFAASTGPLSLYLPQDGAVQVSLAREVKPVVRRNGVVRLFGRSMVDADGTWPALGASLFWAVRGISSGEILRLTENVAWLRAHGVDFIRTIADTTDWGAAASDPRKPDFADRLRMLRQLCWDLHGMRIAWTLFGGNQLTPSEQRYTAEQVLTVCREWPEAVQYVEVSNEGQGFEGADGAARMREIGQGFRDHGFITALTSAEHADPSLYDGAGMPVATVHFDRDVTKADRGWRPVRQPWGYWELTKVPSAFINNEPIGPMSSVAQDDNPVRLAAAAVTTWLSGGCAHVIHTGAGIYGDHPRVIQTVDAETGRGQAFTRPINVWEHPTLEKTLELIARMREVIPNSVVAWDRANHYWANRPFACADEAVGDEALKAGLGCVRAYSMVADIHFVTLVTGVMQEMTLVPTKPATYDVWAIKPTGLERIIGGVPGVENAVPLVLKDEQDAKAFLIVGYYR